MLRSDGTASGPQGTLRSTGTPGHWRATHPRSPLLRSTGAQIPGFRACRNGRLARGDTRALPLPSPRFDRGRHGRARGLLDVRGVMAVVQSTAGGCRTLRTATSPPEDRNTEQLREQPKRGMLRYSGTPKPLSPGIPEHVRARSSDACSGAPELRQSRTGLDARRSAPEARRSLRSSGTPEDRAKLRGAVYSGGPEDDARGESASPPVLRSTGTPGRFLS